MSNEIMKIPKCIIFDFDRTLVYLYEDKRLLQNLGICVRKFYSEYVNVDDHEEKDGYFVWHDLHRKVREIYDEDIANKINSGAEELVTKFEAEVSSNRSLFKDAVYGVPKLSSCGIKLAIVSSNSTDVVLKKMEEHNLAQYFRCIEGRKLPFDPDLLKPNPFPINHAIGMLEEKVEDIWYVGDDLIDVDASIAAGVYSVGVTTGCYTQEKLRLKGAKLTFDNIYELCAFVEKGL